MTTDERLGRIDERLERLDHELLGNGQPGKIALLEAKIDDRAADIAGIKQWQAYANGALKVIGTALAFAVTIGGIILAAKLKGG